MFNKEGALLNKICLLYIFHSFSSTAEETCEKRTRLSIVMFAFNVIPDLICKINVSLNTQLRQHSFTLNEIHVTRYKKLHFRRLNV